LARKAIITYGFVTDEQEKLLGVVVMRDLLLAQSSERLEQIMLPKPFYLTPGMPLTEAMRAVLVRHYPVYPVCEKTGRLIGLLRGQMLFEAEAIELSAQPGEMVGVEREERLTTPWLRSLKFRHPWLQVNLFCGLLALAQGPSAIGERALTHALDYATIHGVIIVVAAGNQATVGSTVITRHPCVIAVIACD